MVTGFRVCFRTTKDMGRSVAFYRELLGLTPVAISPHWSELKTGDVSVAIHPSQSDRFEFPKGNRWTVCLVTEDLAGLRAKIRAAGLPILGGYHQTPNGVIFECEDPDGNPVQFIELGSKMEEFEADETEAEHEA